MEIKIGTKIKELRRAKNISQDTLARHLGISFQAVSKWENGSTMPDVTMLPSIALYFGVSIDSLLNYDLCEAALEIDQICRHAFKCCRASDFQEAESILKDGLKRYPNNEMINMHLSYVLQALKKYDEVIVICRILIDTTKDDEIKYDALRILLETYKELGRISLLKEELNAIPELYFTKLELKARLLEGEDAYEAAVDQKHQSIAMAIEMLLQIVNYANSVGKHDIAEKQLQMATQLLILLETDNVTPRDALFDVRELRNQIESIRN